MADISPVAELLGQVIYQFETVKPFLPTYGHLLLSALFPIFIGAHASLSRPSSASKPSKKPRQKALDIADADNDDDDYEEEEDDDDDEAAAEGDESSFYKMQGLEPSDALIFPLTAGLTLGGLYLAIKWLEDPAILNRLLNIYFAQMGIFFAVSFLNDSLLVLRSFVFPRRYSFAGKVWRVRQVKHQFVFLPDGRNQPQQNHEVCQSPLPGVLRAVPLPGFLQRGLWLCRGLLYRRVKVSVYIRGILDFKCLVGLVDIVSGILALAAVGYFAFVVKPWWLTNFLGFSFCYGALRFMSPSTFWTGSLILSSLFFYDIYFVFFTPLMVTVAKKLDVPIKLLFPRPAGPDDAPDVVSLAMLGLGDIVIPGMMIGLALRFDLFLYYKTKGQQLALAGANQQLVPKPQYQSATGAWGERFWTRLPPPRTGEPEREPPYHDARSFPRPYFHASLAGYVVGMVTTLLAMQYSEHAQPALLYLVPGVLVSLWGTALARGQVREMWEFSDAQEDEELAEEEKKNENKAAAMKEPAKPKETRGVFARLWAGDVQSFLSFSQDSPESTPSLPEKSSEKEDTRKKDFHGSLDLFSVSISLPRSTRPDGLNKPSASPTSDLASHDNVMPAGTSINSRTDELEPPPKRPRRSSRLS